MATINKKYGEQYIATASPSTGYRFVKWTGTGVDTTANPATLTCLGDNTLEAIFERLQYTLTVGVSPANSGSIVFDPILPNVIKYNATQALSNGWINTNTDTTKNTYNSTTGEGQLYLNQGVNTIGYYAFEYMDELNTIEIPSNITTISKEAFKSCRNLTSIILPSDLEYFDNSYALSATAIETITIPSSLRSLGLNTFESTPLKNVIGLENSLVTSIPSNCFRNTRLENITLPAALTYIGDYAFDGAFNNLSVRPAVSLTIPANVEEIGDHAFDGCDRITSLTCLATTPPTLTGTDIFSLIGTHTLYVPAASVSAYQSSNWHNYFTTITAIQ